MERLKSRKTGVWLHWIAAVTLSATLAASSDAAARGAAWVFAVVAALWLARTLLAGPMARPGAELGGTAAAVHIVIHRGMLALVAATALAGIAAPGTLHERLVLATMAGAVVHVGFNLWREASGAKVLRRMMP